MMILKTVLNAERWVVQICVTNNVCEVSLLIGNEARFPKVNSTVHYSICSQLNNIHDHIHIPLKQSVVSLSVFIAGQLTSI